MKAVARERLLALVVALSVTISRAFVSPAVPSRLTSIPPRERGLASSAAAAVVEHAQEVLDFAIVGGGPAGLAAAVGLKQKGLNVKVFEGALLGGRG